MSIKFKLSQSETAFTIKPSDKQIKQLQFSCCTKTIQEVISFIEAGKSFCCATFRDNYRSGKKFINQQLFGVDIDGTLSLAEINAICDDYGIIYNFGYPTFNHTEECPRYRLMFLLDGYVVNKEVAEGINKTLVKLFDGKADKRCVDVARIWHGTNKKVFLGNLEQRLNLIEFLDILNFKIYSRDKKQTRACFHSNNISKETTEIEESENCGKERSSIIYYNSNSNISTDCTFSLDNIITSKEKIENWELDDLLQFEIFRRFYFGEASGKDDKLDHWELFGIATNLYPLVGGRKLFNECLNKNPNYAKEKYDIISYVHSYKSLPMHLYKFSPFESDKNHQYQTFPRAVKKQGKINEYMQIQTIPVEDMYPKFLKKFNEVQKATDNKVYLFLVAPGMGKSVLSRNMEGVILAYPDHKLKDEHYNASKLPENQKISTPNIRDRFSKPVAAYIDALYQIGLRDLVNIRLRALSEGINIFDTGTIEPKDINAANEYLTLLNQLKETAADKSVFTTHPRAIQMLWEKHHTIVFDEDPMNAIIEKHTVTKADLTQIWLNMGEHPDAERLLHLIKESSFEKPKPTPSFNLDTEALYRICIDKKLKSQVINFFRSDSYYIDEGEIHYVVSNVSKFSLDKKYIICDATASVQLYQRLFGDRLEVVDFSRVTNKGQIIQYTSLSYSKKGFKKYGTQVLDTLDVSLPTITHLNYKHLIPNATDDCHFGRVRGTNMYEGMDINVVGTLNYNDSYYRLLSSTLGLEVTNFQMEKQKVRYNGREFPYTTYIDPILQRIHLETVEAELLQAAHRARLIRHNVTVYLYSSFPLAQAKYIY